MKRATYLPKNREKSTTKKANKKKTTDNEKTETKTTTTIHAFNLFKNNPSNAYAKSELASK